MTSTLSWGIISTARINRRFIPPAHESARSTVLAVASRNLESAAAFAKQWDIPLSFGRYEALLAMPEIDAVYIPLPNSLHHEWVIKAAEAGKHILCEKPLALTVAEVDDMIAAAQANGVTLLEAVVYQMHPQLARLKAVLAGGLIGQVKVIRAYYGFTWPQGATNIRLNKSLGGGSLWDVGSYPVSLANTIAGEPPVRVSGFQQTDAGVDVTFVGQMQYPNGTLAQFSSSFRAAYHVGAELIGDQGRIRLAEPFQPNVDHKGSGLVHITPDDTETLIETEVANPYACQVTAMERAVLDGEPVPYSLQDSRLTVETINALFQSAEQGSAVKL
jgi:predicted dehydrogenase